MKYPKMDFKMDITNQDNTKVDHPDIENTNPDNSKVDHSKMDHSKHKNAPMGMEGHDHSSMIADYKKRFYVVLMLTVPIVLLSTMIQKFIGVNWQFTGSPYILFALSSVVFFYGGWPFLKGWIEEIKTKNPGMFFLIGFAITVAYTYSVATVFGLKDEDFFWELSTLILIMLLGHWIEMKSIAGASKELELLVQLMPSDAHLVMPGKEQRKITTIVFDKTGTLTVGKFQVSKIVSLQKDLNENEIIRLASALEQKSEHPIATGILQKIKDLSTQHHLRKTLMLSQAKALKPL